MELWKDVMRCSRSACILLLAAVLLAACGMAYAGEIPECFRLKPQQQQRVTQQERPARQQQRAGHQQQRVMNQQHAPLGAPLLVFACTGFAAAPAAANLAWSDAKGTVKAGVLGVAEEKQQRCSISTEEKRLQEPQRQKERRLLQTCGDARGEVLPENSTRAGAATKPAADSSCRAAAQRTAAYQAEQLTVLPTYSRSAASYHISILLQRQRSCRNQRLICGRSFGHSSRRGSCVSRRKSSRDVCGGHGETGRSEKYNTSSRGASCNIRSSSTSDTQDATGDCLSSNNTKLNSLSRCSNTGNDSRKKNGKGTSRSSSGSRSAAKSCVWPAAHFRTQTFAAAVGASPFVDAKAGQSNAIVAAVGAAAAKVLAFFIVRGVSQRRCSTAGVAASLAAAVATFPPAVAARSSPVAAPVSPSSGPPSSVSSSFVSLYPSPSSSSASSSLSASLASQRTTATPAKARAPVVHASETAAADNKDISLLQQTQNSQQREHEQQQSDGSSRSSFEQGQQQEKLRVQPVGQKQQQQQPENKTTTLRHFPYEESTTFERLSLRPSAHLATISLRQEQQQQHPEDLKDDDWSSRVRISSRGPYASEKHVLHIAAAPAASWRLWEAEGRKEGKAAGVSGKTAATAAAAAAENHEAVGDHRSSSVAELKAAAATLTKGERHPVNSSTISGSKRKASATYVPLKAEQQRQQQQQQAWSQQQFLEKRQRDDGAQHPGLEMNKEKPRQQDLPKSRARISLLEQNQWREGVDNKRFPCVLRGKTTEGSVIQKKDDVRTEHKCQRLCRRETNCTHAVLDTSGNICYLKTGVIDPKDGAAEDVLIPYNCADCWHLNSGVGGNAFLNRKLYSPFSCLTYCLAQVRCTWWQYSVYDQTCFLFAEASEANVQKNRPGLVAGKNEWCPLTDAELQELEAPEEGEAHAGSGWIRSQCMQPPHTKSLANAFEQFSSVSTADLCQKECQKRPLCRYIDFDRTNSVCRLFEKGGYNVESANNYVAGPRTCNMSCFLGGRKIQYLGPGITEGVWEVAAETTMDCQVKCNEDIWCKKFSYCTESGQCILSRKGPSRADSSGGDGYVEGEEEFDEEDYNSPEQELSHETREAAGCYVGPANFCTSRG